MAWKRPTSKELEVLHGLSRGLSVEQIAHALGKSVYTVRTQREDVRRKLGARNTTEAVAQAMRLGLIR